MKKELVISTKFDTAEFDKSVESMQKKLKELYAPSDAVRAQTQQRTSQMLQQAGYGPLAGAPGQGDVNSKMNEYKRNMDKAIREEKSNLENKMKALTNEEKSYKKINEEYAKLIKAGKEDLKLKNQLKEAQEALTKAKNEEFDSEVKINGLLQERQRINTVGAIARSHNVVGGGMMDKALQAMGGLGGVAKGIGSASGLVLGAGGVYNAFQQSQARGEQARGSALSGTVGRDINDAYSGRLGYEAPWSRERGQASGLAAKQASGNRGWDWAKVLAALGAGTAGGAYAGGVVGAAATPMLGGIGALPGAAAGGALGFAGAGAGLMMGDRTKERMLSMLPNFLGGGEHQKRYDALIAQQQSQDRLQNYEALKEQDPAKKAAMERYEQTAGRDLATQRTLGIGDQGLYGAGGLEARAAGAGFGRDQAHRMAAGIVGAGGSARMGQQGEFGLQMERGGLTNASGILGAISGSVQSPEASKRAVISIMSEAFKVGLDNTDFAEENRRFTQSAATIIGRTGTVGEKGQDEIARTLGMFMGQRTNLGVQSAQGAYEAYQQRGSQLGGRRGAIRLSVGMQGQLGKLGTQDLTELLSLRPEEITEDNPTAQYFANKAGFKSVDELNTELKKGTAASRFLIPRNQRRERTLQTKLSEYMGKTGLSYQQLTEKSHMKGGLPADITSTLGEFTNLMGQESGEYMTQAQREAAGGEFFPGAGAAGTGKAQKLLTDVGGKLGDQMEAANAKAQDDGRKAFVDMIGDIRESIKGPMDDIRNATTDAAGALRTFSKGGRPDLPMGSSTNQEIIGPLMQPQSNKPAPGSTD